MDTRELTVQIYKSGRGTDSSRMDLPISWFKDMGIDREHRKCVVTYDKKTITIKKSEG